MAIEKIINTRVQLKYDSYERWTAENTILKSGELAIAYLGPTHTTTSPDNGTHPVLFKVGPGKFNDLPWASALAADVYAWAKKETPDWNDFPALPLTVVDNESGKFVTDFEYANDTLTIHRGNVEWSDVQSKPDFDALYKRVQETKSYAGSTIKTVTSVTQNEQGVVEVVYGDIAFPTAESLGAVLSVAGKEAIKSTEGQNPEISLALDNSGNVTLSQSDTGLKANIDLSAYKTDAENEGKYKQLQDAITAAVTDKNVFVYGADQAANGEITVKTKAVDFSDYYTKSEIDLLPHENTAHNHVNGAGTKVSAAGGTDGGEVKVNLNVAFEVNGNTVTMYDKDDTSKAALATIDATTFIKDGMLHDVEYNAATNKLIFTWNTDAGEKTDEVTLTDILDPYVFEAGALLDVATEGTKVTYSHETVAAPTETEGFGRKYLTGVTTDGYGHITGFTTASETDQDLSGYKTRQSVYNAAGSNKKTVTAVSQDENGEIAVTYADIDFSHNHDEKYKVLQTPVVDPTANGSTLAFIDSIAQNANGEISVTKKNVNLNDYALKSELPVVNDGKFTVKAATNGALTGTGSMTANQAGDSEAVLDVAEKGIKTAHIADNAVGAAQLKSVQGYTGADAEVWVFNCGSATELVD